MKLTEAQGKELFRRYGVPVPSGYLVRSAEEIKTLNSPVVVKAQVRAGGRGKAGGIRFASTDQQAKRAVADILAMSISGERVKEVLIEDRLNVMQELYLSISLDRSSRLPLLLAITQGGMDVESSGEAKANGWQIHPFIGVQDYVVREAAEFLGLGTEQARQLRTIVSGLYDLFLGKDCELVEVNPLVRTVDGRLVAADSKVIIDEDAAFRHPDLPSQDIDQTPLEREAREKGLSLVQLDGDIGVIANGAGLTMATLDNLSLKEGRGGVFLDLGGTDDEKVVEGALELMAKAGQKVILINIFGGITKCDTVAEGVIRAKGRLKDLPPLVVRVRGVNEEKAAAMLEAEGIKALHDLDEACTIAARFGRGEP
ncbi:MAG: ATP-grasp domain-containing protein [Methanomassiliicoccales archaeon]|jgi:succinyl-CoA synthetase beta subunit